jgi:hypothetical protein
MPYNVPLATLERYAKVVRPDLNESVRTALGLLCLLFASSVPFRYMLQSVTEFHLFRDV